MQTIKFQGPTLFRMGVGGGATWLGFHLENFAFEDAWLPITASAFNHLMPVLKRWYNSPNPVLLRDNRPSEAQAFAIFLVKGTLVFIAYNYLSDNINQLVDTKSQDFSSIAATAFIMILSQSPWAQSFLRDAELSVGASPHERMESLQRLNLRIVILGSLTIALNKLAVLQIEYLPQLQAAVIAAGVAHYVFAPHLRQRFQVPSLAEAAVQKFSQGIRSCMLAVKALGKV